MLESQQNQCLQRHLGYHLLDQLCWPRVCRCSGLIAVADMLLAPLRLWQTANSDGSTPPGSKRGNSRALQIVAGFILFALGFNAVSGLMHRKLPSYMLQSLS